MALRAFLVSLTAATLAAGVVSATDPAHPAAPATPAAPHAATPAATPHHPMPAATTDGAQEMFSGKITALTATTCTIQADSGGAPKMLQLGHVKADPTWKVGDHVVVHYNVKTNALASMVKD